MSAEAIEGRKRDFTVIGLIGLAHGLSHFYQLALPALFLLIRDDWQVSFAALGFTATLFYVVSGTAQTFAGFAVDKFGARPVLLGGLALYSAGIALMGMAPNYGFLLLAAVVAGLGNSVFHPADLGILNACVAQQRLGPAFSVHSITGNIGWALAPGVMTALALLFGWRGALLMASFAGIAVLLALWLAGTKIDDRRGAADTRSVAGPSGAQVLLQRSILLCFVFFTLLSSGLIGLQTFGIPTFVKLFGLSPAQAASAVTAFLLGGACGMLAGGMLASRASNHGVLAASGMGLAAAIVALMGLGVIPAVLVTAALALTGFCTGVTFPSRDLLVRSATPKGSTGKVYGFVYSGLDAGAAVAPVLFGWLLDHGQSVLVLAAVACAWAATIVTIFLIDREIN